MLNLRKGYKIRGVTNGLSLFNPEWEGKGMIVRMDDFYRINYKGKEFGFKVIELKESTHMCIVGSEEKVQELMVEFLKPKDESDEDYYPALFDALKEGCSQNFWKECVGSYLLF